MGHYAAGRLPNRDVMLKFRDADTCAKEGEEHQKRRFMHFFGTFEGRKWAFFVLLTAFTA